MYRTLLASVEQSGQGESLHHEDTKRRALAHAASRGQRGVSACRLLLAHGASPVKGGAATLSAAAASLNLEMLKVYAGAFVAVPYEESDCVEPAHATALPRCSALFGAALGSLAASDDDRWLSPRGLEVVQLLLDHGARGPEVDAAFCRAARACARDAFDLLATAVGDDVIDAAFALATATDAATPAASAPDDDGATLADSIGGGAAMAASTTSTSSLSVPACMAPDGGNLWLPHTLLELGVSSQACIDAAFLRAVDAYLASPTSSVRLVDTLLSFGADVDCRGGEALRMAAAAGDVALLAGMVDSDPGVEALALALAEALVTPRIRDEATAVALVDVLLGAERGERLAKVDPPEGYHLPLFAALAAHPAWTALLRRLLAAGCDTEATVEHFLYDDEPSIKMPEPTTVLLWAIGQSRRVPDDAILVLINANGEFRCVSARPINLSLAAFHYQENLRVGQQTPSSRHSAPKPRP